jgi:hypothetical protein
MKKQVFLSHSGKDRDKANEFTSRLRELLAQRGLINIRVFNTSEPEHRFADISHDQVSCQDIIKQRRDDLATYLRSNILDSVMYLLFITKNSMNLLTEWIRFEVEIAYEISQERFFFFPIVAEYVESDDWVQEARKFQAVFLLDEYGESEDQWDSIISAIERNYRVPDFRNYLVNYTRYGRQAHEWESRGHSKTYLLRGKALDEALQWLGEISDMAPAPSDLQMKYISVSRMAASREKHLRLVLILATTVLVLLIGYFCLCYFVQ